MVFIQNIAKDKYKTDICNSDVFDNIKLPVQLHWKHERNEGAVFSPGK